MSGFIGEDDSIDCKVVINHEGQYSIWPSNWDNPNGWREVGYRGTRRTCLEYIEEVWEDMNPESLKTTK